MTNPIGATSTGQKYQTPRNSLKQTWEEPSARTMAEFEAQQAQSLRVPNLEVIKELFTNAKTEAPQSKLSTPASKLLEPANQNLQLTAELPTDKLLQEYDTSLQTLAAEHYANLHALTQSNEADIEELKSNIETKFKEFSAKELRSHHEAVKRAEEALLLAKADLANEEKKLLDIKGDSLEAKKANLLKAHQKALQTAGKEHEKAVSNATGAYYLKKNKSEELAEKVNSVSTAFLSQLPQEGKSTTPNSFQDSITGLGVLKKNLLSSAKAKPQSNNSGTPTTSEPLSNNTTSSNNNEWLPKAGQSMLTPRTKPSVSLPNNETSASKPTIESMTTQIKNSNFISAEDKQQRLSLIKDFDEMLSEGKKGEAFNHLNKMITNREGVLASKLKDLWNATHPNNPIG